MRKVIHKQRYIELLHGGNMNTTLCGRVSHADEDGTNVTEKYDEVTCKFCLNQMYNREIITMKEFIERTNSQSNENTEKVS